LNFLIPAKTGRVGLEFVELERIKLKSNADSKMTGPQTDWQFSWNRGSVSRNNERCRNLKSIWNRYGGKRYQLLRECKSLFLPKSLKKRTPQNTRLEHIGNLPKKVNWPSHGGLKLWPLWPSFSLWFLINTENATRKEKSR
jgi:hypothetical protein